MKDQIETIVEEYRISKIDRRDFFTRLIAVTGTYAAAQLFLERSGLAQTVVSKVESDKANVDSSTVEYMSGDIKLSGYLSKPKKKGKYPAIIVIHENRGLNDHTRDVARRFAAEGFVALAADALSRKGGTAAMDTPEKVREAFTAIAPDIMKDLNAGLTFLNSHANVKKGKLASIGFCWGGARSFLLSTEQNELKAAVVFYGTPPADEILAKVHCPVFGFYGETDTRITSTVPKVTETMAKLNKKYESKIYKGAAHAFFNDTNAERYNAEAAKDAWTQTLAFLKKNV